MSEENKLNTSLSINMYDPFPTIRRIYLSLDKYMVYTNQTNEWHFQYDEEDDVVLTGKELHHILKQLKTRYIGKEEE